MIKKIKDKGTLLTISLVILIILGGVLIIDRPGDWLTTLAVVIAGLCFLFVFINARVFIKALAAVGVALVGSAMGFEVSVEADPSGILGNFWGLLYLALFFTCLSISYFFPSSYSRWTVSGITMVISWPLFLVGANLFLSAWGIVVAAIIGLVFFCVFYIVIPRRGLRDMPENTIEKAAIKGFINSLEKNGWDYIEFREKREKGYIVLWDKDHPATAYVLYPVAMDQPFGVIGTKKKQALSYKGRSINFWLQWVTFKIARNSLVGTSPLVVIWRFSSSVSQSKVIGMKTPDLKDPVAVGLLEGKSLKRLKQLEEYSGVLKLKHMKKLEEAAKNG